MKVETPYYRGRVNALCMIKPLYDLILANIDDVRAPDDPMASQVQDELTPDTCEQPATPDISAEYEAAAVVTRAQAKRGHHEKRAPCFWPLKTHALTPNLHEGDSYAEEERDKSLKTCFAQIGKESINPKNKCKIDVKRKATFFTRILPRRQHGK